MRQKVRKALLIISFLLFITSFSSLANIVTSLGNRTEVTILAESGEFYKIQYEDITGYVAKFLISEE